MKKRTFVNPFFILKSNRRYHFMVQCNSMYLLNNIVIIHMNRIQCISAGYPFFPESQFLAYNLITKEATFRNIVNSKWYPFQPVVPSETLTFNETDNVPSCVISVNLLRSIFKHLPINVPTVSHFRRQSSPL